MHRTSTRTRVVAGLLAATALVAVTPQLIAASPSGGTRNQEASASPTPVPTPISTPVDNSQPGPNGGTVVVWFIGLGAGTQPANIPVQQAFVDAYNASQSDIYLSLHVVPNTNAAAVLKTELAAGTGPDIIGPVGVEGLNIFRDQLLDLQPIIDSTGYEFTGVNQELVDFFKLGKEGATIGVPYAVYPSFIFYNKDLFDEAGLDYLPTKVGEMYNGKPWDLDNLRETAMKLTVDKAGNDATSADFDPNSIEQWGFDAQYMDNSARAEGAWFGSGSFLAEDGKTAVIPDYVKESETWFNDGVWKDNFIPSADEINSDLLGKGGEFGSGNLAIDEGHTWFTCCVAPPAGTDQFNFGFAVNPLVNDKITSPLHADTFSILASSKVPEKAWQALTTMIQSPELLATYGAMPADPAKQDAWEATIDAGFPGITLDWTVPEAMLAYPDSPNHQSWVPNYAKAKAAFQAFQNKYRTTEGVDINAEIATLQQTLQGIFDEPEAP